MGTVGVRELKAHLSLYLKKVKAGEKLIVTDRNQEIAMIVPREVLENEEHIFQLVKRGIISWSGGKPIGSSPRVASRGKSVSDAVLEDRR